MTSIIFQTAARVVVPLQLLFALFLLVRGHNEPGGGFIGGLIAGAAIILHGLAHGLPAARRLLRIDPRFLIGLGLTVAAGSGFLALATGQIFMTGLWGAQLPTIVAGPLKLGTPVLFDLGVFLLVSGISMVIAFAFMEDD